MDNGLKVEDVKVMASAAGGPKWIILYHLDRYLMQHFLSEHQHTIHFIGGSIGAWRSMAHLHSNPVEAMNRLSYEYIHQRYSDNPPLSEISAGCYKIVTQALRDDAQHILQHPTKKLHVGVSQALFSSKEMTESQLKWKFGRIGFQHWLYRKSLNRNMKRLTFSTAKESIFLDDGIASQHIQLDEQNIVPALQASGAIPLVMNPVVINGQDCWDGGVVDYHIDLNYNFEDGIVLHPHFFGHIKPGWFDKHHPFRYSKHHDNTLLLYPSEAFINMLPNQKLTDLKDFYAYADDQDKRMEVWLTARELGKYLAEDFERLLDIDVLRENLEEF